MKTKLLLFIAIMSMTLTFAKTNKTEINQIIKQQSDGVITSSQKGISTVYKDGTSVVKTVYKDVKSLSPKVESAIKSLATELKTTTDALWNILVKQQSVWSWCFLILTLSSLFNWYLFYKRNFTKLKKDDYVIGKEDVYSLVDNPQFDSAYYNRYREYEGREAWRENWTNIKYLKEIKQFEGQKDILISINNPNNNWFKYLHLIICLSLSLLSIYHFSDMLTGFLNPEFGALKTIAEIAIKLK